MATTGRVTQAAARVAIEADADVAQGRVTQAAARVAMLADADVAQGRLTQVVMRVAVTFAQTSQPLMKRATTVPYSRQWHPRWKY